MIVPIESRKIGNLMLELICPTNMLIAIEKTINAKVRLERVDDFGMNTPLLSDEQKNGSCGACVQKLLIRHIQIIRNIDE